ncbi:hypothetical protein RchiOBHm_Chr5g0013791 [Rosa chinensis]|uniref:Uncharacterized protein n=1 Tax=Rosa chinensis TaxID=74649 RepID=A0A2P6Q5J1_ROSCH|nr:hypothetical protein RchiOBHm_Chr5g0013791 [Rosa chinensis]
MDNKLDSLFVPRIEAVGWLLLNYTYWIFCCKFLTEYWVFCIYKYGFLFLQT